VEIKQTSLLFYLVAILQLCFVSFGGCDVAEGCEWWLIGWISAAKPFLTLFCLAIFV